MNTINLLICIAIAIVITLDVLIIIMLHFNSSDIMDYIFRYHNINEEYLKKIIQEIREIKKQQPGDCADVKYEKVNIVRDKKTGRFIRGNK